MSKTTLILTLRATPPLNLITDPYVHHVLRNEKDTRAVMKRMQEVNPGGRIILFVNSRIEECFAHSAYRYAKAMGAMIGGPNIPLGSIPFNKESLMPILRAWIPLQNVEIIIREGGFGGLFTEEARAQIIRLYRTYYGKLDKDLHENGSGPGV